MTEIQAQPLPEALPAPAVSPELDEFLSWSPAGSDVSGLLGQAKQLIEDIHILSNEHKFEALLLACSKVPILLLHAFRTTPDPSPTNVPLSTLADHALEALTHLILLFRSISFPFAALCFLSFQAITIGEMKLGQHTMESMKIQEHFVVIRGEMARMKGVGEMEGVLEQSRDEGYAIMQQGQVWFQSRMPDMLEAVREGLNSQA